MAIFRSSAIDRPRKRMLGRALHAGGEPQDGLSTNPGAATIRVTAGLA
jgi:hypothetical protein